MNIQIPKGLFLDLCRWHLGGVHDPELEKTINAGLQAKLDAIVRRQQYGEEHARFTRP